MLQMKTMIVGPNAEAVLHCGDCREILDVEDLGKVDAVVTDPPYGVNFEYNTYDDTEENWYDLMDYVVPRLREIAPFVVMPVASIDRLGWWYQNHTPSWVVIWYRGSTGARSRVGFNMYEPHLVWGMPPKQMTDLFQVSPSIAQKEVDGHPCPKPIEYAEWLVTRASPVNGVVLDPFMGSGTTGVACARTRRRFIGIEMDPVYFEISAKRIADAYSQTFLFSPEEDLGGNA